MSDYLPLRSFGQANPTREDALEALRLTLAVLQAALPIALRSLGTASIEDQYWFWYALRKLDDESELVDAALDAKDFVVGFDEAIQELQADVGALLLKASEAES